MIVSSREIHRVLGLTKSAGEESATAGASLPPSRGGRTPGADPTPRTFADREARTVRVKSLRELLASGAYEVPDEMLAEKMIGRALCDQISCLYDEKQRAGSN